MENVFSTDKPERYWWGTIIILIVLIIVLVIVFGPVGEIRKVVCLELALGVAALVVGGLLGFLFGIPKTTPQGAVTKSDFVAAKAAGATTRGTQADGPLVYEPSANLEQVADWLTKILLGASLVQLKEIRKSLIDAGSTMQEAFGVALPGVAILTQVIIVSFVVIGFLASYLWTRIHYGEIQARADRNLYESLAIRVAEAEQERNETKETLKKISEKGLVTQTAATAAAEGPIEEKTKTWSADLQSKIEKLNKTPSKWKEDTVHDIFGALPDEANGRKLEAEMLTDLTNKLMILLRVSRMPGGQPLVGEVTFLLHSTYRKRVVSVPAENDQAELTISAAGWFTAGAIADDGQTILAYDLRALPGAPKWFTEA